jgi:Domain of unknown function (DUF4258)
VMKIRFSNHATSQMAERKIAETWVSRALNDPEFVREDKVDREVKLAFCRIEEFGDRWLRVAYREEQNACFVVTAFFDRKAENWK